MRRFSIEFPEAGIKVSAHMIENEDHVLADSMWDYLKNPTRFICHHTGSTGGLINCHPLPPEEYPLIPPVRPFVLCDIRPGQLGWDGNQLLLLYDRCTEPIIATHAHVAQVDEEDLEAYEKGCRDVWYHCFLYHTLATIIVAREEEA